MASFSNHSAQFGSDNILHSLINPNNEDKHAHKEPRHAHRVQVTSPPHWTAQLGMKPPQQDVFGSKPSSSSGTVAQLGLGATPPPASPTPLQCKWTYWWCTAGTKTEVMPKNSEYYEEPYEQRLRELLSFNAVEPFWGMYNALKRPSEFPNGHDLAIMRSTIRPMWEDPENNRGGRWVLLLSPDDFADEASLAKDVDRHWLDTLLMVIGEVLVPNADLVNGAVLSLRKRCHRLSVWLARTPDKERIKEVGREIKKRLGLGEETRLYFEYSQAIMKSRSARRRTPQPYVV